ncbi:MAG TPA: class I SAM-dependent methyltransferase [Dehalococcoidales bacterium]|nr:class I SAM-dependent methyltransferase [Dehalococcoidales bacterium]
MPTLREVYDKIAEARYGLHHWTRFRRELDTLASKWQNGRLLNLGCGHGADFLPFKDNFELYGADFSAVELELAQKYALKFDFFAELVQADVSRLPFADESFDWAVSIATYHHLDSREGREQAFSELRRVLKPGGEALVTVWNRWQPWWGGGRGVNARWFRAREGSVPWQTKEGTLYRYYYFFTYPELEKLARRAGLQVLKSFPESSYRFPIKYFSRNICLLVRKPQP